tara:strand:- start:13057 stop:13956 length:900 start_codon:yes stop_codon:yes gene_type:complete
MKLLAFLKDIYSPISGISPRTVKLYEMTLNSWAKFLGYEPTLGDLKMLPVSQYIAHRLQKNKPATAAKDRAQIVALWNSAAKQGYVEVWPQVRRVRVPEVMPESWTVSEFKLLVQTARNTKGKIGEIRAGYFWQALLLTAYDTGERISAIMSLRWTDVSGDNLIFRAETRKNSTRDICRKVGAATRMSIDLIREPKREKVWPWPYRDTYLWYKYGKILETADLGDLRRNKFHKIRRTCASFYHLGGGDAQVLLDHSSPAVTRRYLDPRVVGSIDAASVLPDIIGTEPTSEDTTEPPQEE